METAWLSLYSMISCIFLMMVWSAGSQPTVSRLLLVSHFCSFRFFENNGTFPDFGKEGIHAEVEVWIVVFDSAKKWTDFYFHFEFFPNSRRIASSGVSPFSIFPPGNSHCPLNSPYPLSVARILVGWSRSSAMTAATTLDRFIELLTVPEAFLSGE